MIKAVDIDEKSDYVAKSDRDLPESEQTIWKIGVIDSITMSKLERMDIQFNAETNDTKIQANVLGREIEMVRYGLKGWENFKDSRGEPVKCEKSLVGSAGGSREELTDRCIRQIPIEIIKELAEVIRTQNVVGEAERKN